MRAAPGAAAAAVRLIAPIWWLFAIISPRSKISVKIAECGEFRVNPYWTVLF
jgi:hypothetical protein